MNNNQLLIEQNYLDEVNYVIDAQQKRYLEDTKKFKNSMDNQYKGDHAGRQDWKYYRRRLNKANEKLSVYKNNYKEPYFARMDFKSDKDNLKYYIGKNELVHNGQYYVYDWRSTMGSRYYMKTQKEFERKGVVDQLVLRRNFKIKNKRIKKYIDEFNLLDEFFDGDIIDPFLLSVLEKKKIEKKTTDIISTIQQNQHKIIESPINQHLIVQGCAGSGKTMILLHRLSYWLYNNVQFSKKDVMIISPSDQFIHQYKSLNKTLQLEKIKNQTIMAFYIDSINELLNKNLKLEDMQDDSNLSNDFLKKVYSMEFINFIESEYHQWFKDLYEKLDMEKLKILLKRFDIEYENQNHDVYSLQIFESYPKSIKRRNQDYKERIMSLQNEFELVKEKLRKQLINKNKMSSKIKVLENKIGKKMASFKIIEELFSDEVIDIAEVMRILTQENLILNEKVDSISSLKIKYENDLNEIENLELEIMSIEEELENISFYHMIRKFKLKNSFKIKTTRLKHLENHLVRDIELKYMSYDNMIHKLEDYKREMRIFNVQYKKIKEYYQEIVSMKNTKQSILNKIKEGNEEAKKIEKEFKLVQSKILDDHEEEYIQNLLDTSIIIDDFSYWFTKSVTRKFEQENNYEFSNYHKYTLMAILWVHSLYQNRKKLNYKYFFIDEGQDLNQIEYQLIKNISKYRTFFNIFGDYNQNIYRNIGLTDWSYLKVMFKPKYYSLQENYRNPMAITNQCNRLLNINITAFGYNTSDDYKKIPLNNFKTQLKFDDSSVRRVLIVKDDFDRNKYKNSDINILTVSQVKGMEFTKVYVDDNNMSKYEKYVAYTRALKELRVIEY